MHIEIVFNSSRNKFGFSPQKQVTVLCFGIMILFDQVGKYAL